ncbi:MAG: hypothetical protein EP338_05715 [Bacteroidetes bacterium]|nr:MAG: hypothetical protein EP338_05715 [Bacteroidota bacterium]
MKKIILTLTLLGSFVLLNSCKSGETDPSTNETSQKESDEQKQAENMDSFAFLKELAPKKSFSPEELARLCTFLYKKEIVLSGYPYAYAADTEIEFVPNSTGILNAKNNSISSTEVKIKFKEGTENRKLKAGELFAVKGKIDVEFAADEQWGNTTTIKIWDAEFVESVQDTKGQLSSIDQLDLTVPVYCGDLHSLMHQHFEAIRGKGNITVTGDYQLTITSKTSYGTHWNVTLGKQTPIRCYTKEEPNNDRLNQIRSEGKQISAQGVLQAVQMGGVDLEECVILNK